MKGKWTSELNEKKWKTKGGKGWKGDTEKQGHIVAGRLVRRAKIKMVVINDAAGQTTQQ